MVALRLTFEGTSVTQSKHRTTNMATVQAVHSPRFMEFLTTPWVDKTIEVVAITPNVVELCHRYTDTNLTFVRAVAGTQTIWSSQGSVDTLLCALRTAFERLWTHGPEVTMASGSIVERVDVVGHICGR